MRQVLTISRQTQMSTKNKASNQATDPKSISDHLGELRRRLTWVVLSLIGMSAVAYSVHDALVSFVLSPIGDQKLVYLTPGGGFTFIFQIVLYAGLLLSAPVAVYHLYRFIAPALPEAVRSKGMQVVVMSSVLMMGGALFGYFVAVPAALQFLTAFAGDFVQANLTAESYLNFLVAYVLGLGLMFQLPLFLIGWNWINPLPPGGLLSSQRFVIVGAFIAAALLTPTPDVVNQTLLAAPIIAVYQVGVVAVYMMNRKGRRSSQPAQLHSTSRLEEPVFDTSLLLAAEEQTLVAAPVKMQTRITQQVRELPAVNASVKPVRQGTVDGFQRRRSVAVAIPHRQVPVVRPALQRASATHASSAALRNGHRSIDGFNFVKVV